MTVTLPELAQEIRQAVTQGRFADACQYAARLQAELRNAPDPALMKLALETCEWARVETLSWKSHDQARLAGLRPTTNRTRSSRRTFELTA